MLNPPFESPLPHPLSADMQQHPSPFLSLYDHSPPRRAPQVSAPTLKASIWAPQPQPSDVTWPRALEAFSRCAPAATREDIFGPSNNLGVVGDARVSSKSSSGNWSASPDLRADTHVEQLLRTLNLNSPEPSLTAGSSPKSTGSAGSGSGASGRSLSRTKPAPPPLDLSFGSTSASNSSMSTANGSASISATTGSTSTSADDSLPSLTRSASGSASYPQSPDFSPVSLSSALLTPLDSPHGLHSQSPLHGFHSSGHGLSASIHAHSPGAALHSPTHSLHPHSPLSPGHALPLHSPSQLFYKERYAAFDPPSPYSPGGIGATGAPSRFLPLPPTPPGATAYPLGNSSNIFGSPNSGAGSFGLGLGGMGAGGALFGGARAGEPYYRTTGVGGGAGSGDWLHMEDGLGLGTGLGLGFGQSTSVGGLGAGNAMYGGGALGAGFGSGGALGLGLGSGMDFGAGMGPRTAAGAGAFAGEEADRGFGALRGSFAYPQQLAQQQHLLQQQLLQQRQLQSQAQQQYQQQLQQDGLGLGLEVGGGAEFGSDGKASELGLGAGNGGASGTGVGAAGAGGTAGGSNGHGGREGRTSSGGNEPINFLSLLHPSSSPPYPTFVARIIKSADQQASIFLQQKLKVAGPEERARIVDAICARGAEMMMHRFGNWAVQRCLEAATGPEERRKIVGCMRGRIVDLATNCYGCHVLQKALDCEEEEVRLLIVSELLMGDPAQTLVNKHASHVWSKIMELSWTPPAPPIFAYVNKSLKGKWAALACHETGSLVVQHAFENLEEIAKDGIVDELLGQGAAVFAEVAKSQWGSYCIQHILEHGSEKHRQMALDHLLDGLLEFATNEQGSKSVVKALKEGGKETLDRVVQRMCEPAKGARRATVVDLALSLTGSQLIASVLPNADKDQRAMLYDCIRGHIVTLRGCKTGSKVIWLFDRMRAYYGY
ncbi:armadillo-type protein [Mycena pura]|uniref:Armadillo-type protein n=1 Tax=Mycena pura TaxID=153505 RepID=A0AAD6VCG6_9AGAR|nr:armadillo-type protein [Mycena pura]